MIWPVAAFSDAGFGSVLGLRADEATPVADSPQPLIVNAMPISGRAGMVAAMLIARNMLNLPVIVDEPNAKLLLCKFADTRTSGMPREYSERDYLFPRQDKWKQGHPCSS